MSKIHITEKHFRRYEVSHVFDPPLVDKDKRHWAHVKSVTVRASENVGCEPEHYTSKEYAVNLLKDGTEGAMAGSRVYGYRVSDPEVRKQVWKVTETLFEEIKAEALRLDQEAGLR